MPTLDSAFQVFVTWQTALFCLGIAIITYVVRTIVEAVWKGATTNNIWNEVGVRLGPILMGMGLVFVTQFPWPAQISGSPLARVFYGATCGIASAYIYAAFKAWLNTLAGNGFSPAVKLHRALKMKPVDLPVTERDPLLPEPPDHPKA